MKKTLLLVIIYAGLSAYCSCSLPKDKTPLEYTDELVLDNGIVRLCVSPAVGRIVYFGKVGGRDLLWRNSATAIETRKRRRPDAWLNYGGDKIWPAVRYSWGRIYGPGWSLDKAIDGSAWTVVEKTDSRIIIESPVSKQLHIKIRREITLIPGKAAARIKNTLQQISYTPYPVCLWSVTQVKSPRCCLLDIDGKRLQSKEPYVVLSGTKDVNVRLLPDKSALKFMASPGKSKVGTFGGWIAAVYPDCIFRQSSKFYQNGCYPDNASVECFWLCKGDKPTKGWNPDYVELELMGNSVHLQPGEKIRNVVNWEIIDTTQGFRKDFKL